MKSFVAGRVLALAACLLVANTLQVRSQTIYWDFDNGFYPSSGVINPGDTVTWANVDIYGFSVNISGDGFSSFLLDVFESMGVTFNTSGDYSFQSDFGDTGSIHVNFPPSVTITNPANDAVLTPPATFDVKATASDPDDIVWQVEFYLNDTDPTNMFALDTAAPYSGSITNLAPGAYTLIAIAEDYFFLRATNTINITVGNPQPLSLSAPRLSGNQFLFDVSGLTAGKTNVVQVSTNLSTWTGVATNVADSSSKTVTNALIPGAMNFRLIQLP